METTLKNYYKNRGFEMCEKHQPWLDRRTGYFGKKCFSCHCLNGVEETKTLVRIRIGRWKAVFNKKGLSVWIYKDGRLFTRWTYGTMDLPLPTELIRSALLEVIEDAKWVNNNE